MNEAQILEQRVVRFMASLTRSGACLPPAIIMGTDIALILLSAISFFGGAMLAILGQRGRGQESARLTPRLRAAVEGALASIHHPAANQEEDGVVALALRELFECVAEEYPLVARYAIKSFLQIQLDKDLSLFHVCRKHGCPGEATENSYCVLHDKEMEEFDRELQASVTPEEQAQINEDVERLAAEREAFEEGIRRRFSRRRID